MKPQFQVDDHVFRLQHIIKRAMPVAQGRDAPVSLAIGGLSRFHPCRSRRRDDPEAVTADLQKGRWVPQPIGGRQSSRPTVRHMSLYRKDRGRVLAMQQIADWLETLGLSEYAQCFAENDIDTSVLRHLTDQDLKELGVSLGHRRKMLRRSPSLLALPRRRRSLRRDRAKPQKTAPSAAK